MRTFLKCLAVYLFIGCIVTANVLSNMKLGRGGAEPAIFVLAAGPFIWPVLLPQRISEIIDEREQKQYEAQKEKDEFARNMQTCPSGFEPVCRKYFTRRITNDAGAYAGLLAALQNGMPANEAGQDLVLAMADLYGAGETPLRVETDILALLDAATLSDKAPLNLAGAALLLGSLRYTHAEVRHDPESDVWIPAFREPYQDAALAAERAHILHRILAWRSEAAPRHATPSLGLATLYEAYSNVLADPAAQKLWRDKALAEYADAAKRLELVTDVANALEGYCTLAGSDEDKIRLLREVRESMVSGRVLRKDWPVKSWPPPLWRLPYGGTIVLQPPAGGHFLKQLLPLFSDRGQRIEAVGLLLELFRKTGAWDDSENYFLRESIYEFAGKEGKLDPRWADLLLRLLQKHDLLYEQRRSFYEAERAWFLGDEITGERLLRDYMGAHGKSGSNYYLFWGRDCRSPYRTEFCTLFHTLSK